MELKLKQPKSLSEIAKLIAVDLPGDVAALEKIIITSVSTLEKSAPGCISFLSNPIYKSKLATTQASAVIVAAEDAQHCQTTALISNNPRLALAKILELCAEVQKPIISSIHPTVVIGDNVQIGANVIIGPYVVIGSNCKLGDNSELKPHVTVYDNVTIGARCTIHSNSVLGSDGFGYAVNNDGTWYKMPHLGGVIIGDDVEIGSNTSIDRGMIENTVIGNNVIIDNLVQIGHNVHIGDRSAIAGCVGIAGSTSIGKGCLIGGAACIAGHLTIADNVHITGTSAVNHSLPTAGVYSSGFPAKENSVWRRNVARFMFLDNMAKRIRELEKKFKINETMVGYE